MGTCTHESQPPAEPPPESSASGDEHPSEGAAQESKAPELLPAEAAELVRLLNEERVRHGLPALEVRADLADIANQHSLEMARSGSLYHNDDYFSAETGERIGAGRRGENVAKHASAAKAHDALLRSPGHRANILDPRFTVVGVGAAGTGSGMVYFTENFLRPAAPVVAAAPSSPPAGTVRGVAAAGAGSTRVEVVETTVQPPPPVRSFELARMPAPPRTGSGPIPDAPPVSAAALLAVALVGAGVWRADHVIRLGAAPR